MQYTISDPKNKEIYLRRKKWFESLHTPEVGDVIIFADGKKRRISYIHDYNEKKTLQTSDIEGSFYIGDNYISFSGGLYSPIAESALAMTPMKEKHLFWFFDQDWPRAHSAVSCEINCRIFTCILNAND